MTTYTITGPDGKEHSIDGPPGQSQEQVVAQIQQRLSPGLAKSAASGLIQGAGQPGDLMSSALSGAPPQQPIDKETYYGKLVEALNAARKHLELPTTQQVGNAVGMQPTQPVTGAEKAVQYAGRAIPGMAMMGNPAGRAVMGGAQSAAPIGAAPQVPQVNMQQMPTQRAMGPGQGYYGAQRVPGAPGNVRASDVLPGRTAEDAGAVAQDNLLKQVAKEGIGMAGKYLGGPLGGIVGRLGPKMLGFD